VLTHPEDLESVPVSQVDVVWVFRFLLAVDGYSLHLSTVRYYDTSLRLLDLM